MAWVSSVFGAISGLGLMLSAVLLAGWPAWVAVLLYPFTAALLCMILVAYLFMNSARREDQQQSAQSGDLLYAE